MRTGRCDIIHSLGKVLGHRFACLPVSLMVIAPHPDDEVLGCGGLIARVLAEGGRVLVLVLTGGERSHFHCCNLDGEAIKQARRDLTLKAAERLSLPADNIVFFDWGDGRLADCGPKEWCGKAGEIRSWIQRWEPEAVFAPHPWEGWPDHVVTEKLTRLAVERSGVSCRLFHYCVWFWYYLPLRMALAADWRGARLLDISGVHPQKQAAMEIYLKPRAPCGNPWSGVLPRELVGALRWKKELFFEAHTPQVTSPEQRLCVPDRRL